MPSATARSSHPWLTWGLARTRQSSGRRKSRLRHDNLRRLETLEDRTLLNASIDIDAASLLTYNTDPAAVENLNVSVSGNVYTFASNQNIDIASNVPGLTVTNPGTPLVTVTGITGLAVDAGFAADSVQVSSTNVPTAVNLTSNGATVTLGDFTSPNSLSLLSSPVIVTGPGAATTNSLTIDDRGSPSNNVTYTISSTTIAADDGFGGVTYSGVSFLSLLAALGGGPGVTYNVNGTADGVTTDLFTNSTDNNTNYVFNINGTSSVAGSSLTLLGNTSASGSNTFNILGASSDVNISAGAGPNDVNLGNTQVTSGVTGNVRIFSLAGGLFDVNVDDSSGAAGEAWNLTAQASPSTLAALTGFSSTGSLVYDPAQIHSMSLSTAANQSNGLTVDFANGSPLPANGASPTLNYSGGSPSGASSSDLVLTGALPGGPIGAETHLATGPSSGNISLGSAGSINYAQLSPHSVYDVVPATDYTLNDTADPDGRVLIRDGVNSALTGNVQSLLISSQAATPSFVDTYVANKTNVTVNVANGANATQATVNYGVTTPVAGLSSLTVATGPGPDAAQLIALPPGVPTNIQQGNGDDRANVTVQGTASATATNLDGGLGTNVLNLDAGGLAITAGNFAPGMGGSTVVSGAPLTGGPITYVNYQQVNVTNLAAVAPVVTAATIHAVQGQRQDDIVAGTFTSASPGARATDFLATIQWGDGTQSAGVIVQDASNPSVYYVMGTHTYYEDNPALATRVIVASLGGSSTQIINGVPVSFSAPASDPVTGNGTAVVDNAPISVTAAWFRGVENTTPSPADVFVASFIDYGGVNPADPNPAARYSVLINWGDGTAPLPVPASGIVRNGTSNSYTVTAAQHVYSKPGTYVVTMTVSDGGANAVVSTATGIAYIADAPLTPATIQPLIAPATEGVQIANTRLASFTDADPLSIPGDFNVVIDWGDGSPMSYGSLVQPGGVGTTYFVQGTHTYADALARGASPIASGAGPITGPVTASGTYPIHIYVQDAFGSVVSLTNTITVNDNPLTLVGGLNPASDSGVSNSDGITNVVQPNFQGWTSEGGASVFVYATPTGGSPRLIGQTASDANGAWSVTSSSALADGGYTIQAQAYDASGHTVGALTTVGPALVVDTVGPKVTDVVFDTLGGRVVATLQDYGGVNGAGVGLNQATVVDANNYRLALLKSAPRGYHPPARWLVNAISVQPGTLVGPQVATLQINDGRGIRGGRYLFTARSVDPTNLTGIQDVAGNALDGEFYSYFPSGNNHVGGDFLAGLDAVHHRIFAPSTTVGAATPVSPPGTRGVDRYISRPGRQLPRAASAVKLSAARATARDTSIRQLLRGG